MASGTISFELSTDITYVAGTVNGVETVFIQDEAYPVKWRATVDVAEDSLYHIYLEMYDEAGNKSTYENTIEYILPWFIYDRTQEDVDRVAFFMSHCFVEMGKIIVIDLSFMMMLGWFTLATYMVNEVRSILENLVRMHVNVPQFLIAGLDVTQKLIDSKTNIKEETKSEEIIYQSTDEGQNGRADSSGT